MRGTTSYLFHSVSFLVFIMLVGLSLIGALSYQGFLYFEKREQDAGQVAFDKAYLITREKLNSFVYGLKGVGGVYLAQDFAISQTELREYAKFQKFFDQWQGVLGFGFIRRIPKEEMLKYEEQIKKAVPDIVITRLSQQQFDDFMIIEGIEPIEKNFSARGLDVGSEPNRRAAAVGAWETGEATLTRQIQLVQIDKAEPGFLFYLPMYKTAATPKTLEERRRQLVGWAYAPILASAIGNHLRDAFDAGLDFSIEEDNEIEGGRRIFGTFNGSDQDFSRTIAIGGRNWILRAKYTANTFPGYQWVIPLMGFVFLSSLYGFTLISVRRLALSHLESEKRAQNIEKQMEVLMDGASFGVIGTNLDGVITTVNKATVEMLGYSEQEITSGATPILFHDPEEIQQRAHELSLEIGREVSPGIEVFTESVSSKKVYIREWTFIRKDKSRFPVRLVVTPVLSVDQKVIGYLGIAEDIRELVSMRKTIEQQQQQMITSAKLSSLGEMASGVAHEINNPLAIITSRIKILEKKIAINEIDYNNIIPELSKIDQTVMRIAKIVRGLKAFSRESSQDPKERVRVSTIINDSIEICSEKIRDLEIELRIDPYEDVQVKCQPTQVSQVLVNLLGNSFDAVRSLKDKWVRIEITIRHNLLRIAVIDSGTGISPEIVQKMMQPFFTTKEVGRGTGLGLSISKGIMENHGGQLFYDRESPNTRFVLELPL